MKIKEKRRLGKFYTNNDVIVKLKPIIDKYAPNVDILEPFVGGGSLIKPFLRERRVVVNDVMLTGERIDGVEYHEMDIIDTPVRDIVSLIPDNALILTNPPYGTSGAGSMITKKGEKNHKIKIRYGRNASEAKYFGDKYGRGDLVLPTMGKILEAQYKKGNGYLGVFMNISVFCDRLRYRKLQNLIFENYEPLYMEAFDGSNFEDVSSAVCVLFSLWRFKYGAHTKHEDLMIKYGDKYYTFEKRPLLKDHWHYHRDPFKKGLLRVNANDRFNSPVPKIITNRETAITTSSTISPHNLKVFKNDTYNCPLPKVITAGSDDKSASNINKHNLRKPIPLNTSDFSPEFLVALWSTAVGRKSIVEHPRIFEGCYTALPNFDEYLDIFPYIMLFNVEREDELNYCGDIAGFIGDDREFKYGNYTDEALRLMRMDDRVWKWFNLVKEKKMKWNRLEIRRIVRRMIADKGYWDTLPV